MQGVTNPAKHLIKGLYPWLAENDAMVYYSFNLNHPGVHLTANSFRQEPAMIVTEKGQQIQIKMVTLNLDPQACGKVKFEEDHLYMQCRSNQVLVECIVPYEAMLRMWCPRDTTNFLQVVLPYKYPEALVDDKPKLQSIATGESNPGEDAPTASSETTRPALKRIK